MVARLELGERNRQRARRQNRLDERPQTRYWQRTARGVPPPREWDEVEEYFRRRAAKGSENTAEE